MVPLKKANPYNSMLLGLLSENLIVLLELLCFPLPAFIIAVQKAGESKERYYKIIKTRGVNCNYWEPKGIQLGFPGTEDKFTLSMLFKL